MNRAVFLDRDGVINELVYFPEAGVIDSPFTVNLFHVLPKVPEAIRLLNDSGLKVVVISNQPGVAKSKFTRDVLSDMDNKMTQELSAHGAISMASTTVSITLKGLMVSIVANVSVASQNLAC